MSHVSRVRLTPRWTQAAALWPRGGREAGRRDESGGGGGRGGGGGGVGGVAEALEVEGGGAAGRGGVVGGVVDRDDHLRPRGVGEKSQDRSGDIVAHATG